jgi:hypothetical protein
VNGIEAFDCVIGAVLVVDLADCGHGVEDLTDDGVEKDFTDIAAGREMVGAVDIRGGGPEASNGVVTREGCAFAVVEGELRQPFDQVPGKGAGTPFAGFVSGAEAVERGREGGLREDDLKEWVRLIGGGGWQLRS